MRDQGRGGERGQMMGQGKERERETREGRRRGEVGLSEEDKKTKT